MSNKFFLEKTDSNPEILFDFENNIFSFKGNSLPENVFLVYTPAFDFFFKELQNYASEKNILIDIQIDFLNSSSVKMLMDFCKKCLDYNNLNTSQIICEWSLTSKEDEDMEDIILSISEASGYTIKKISKKI